jgi:serine-protein kinase ATM
MLESTYLHRYFSTETNLTILSSYEHMLTRLLYMANVMVVSSPMRRGAYWHVLELPVYSSVYTNHIESVLRSVAHRMGLSNYSSLFESYASQIAYSLRRAGHDFSRFPPHLLGYGNRREYAEAAFHAFSPTNLLAEDPDIERGRQHFASHCKAIQITVAEGLLKCFADVVGQQILIWTDCHLQNPDDSFPELEIDLRARMQGLEETYDGQLQRNVDGIIIAVLRGLGDQDFRPDGDIVQGLRAMDESEDTILTFQAISRHRSMSDFQVHEPNLPSFSTVTVLRAIRWFHHRAPETDSPATTFHVLHRMFAEILRSPIVNEQLRLVNALSVWIASHHSHFRDVTLLRSLLQWCTVSMSQFDLARVAQSMMEWAFLSYTSLRYAEPRLPDVLISICCVAQDFATHKDAVVEKLGLEILEWVESQALLLCKRSAIRELVMNALPAWPTDPSPELASLLDNMSSAKLSTILADQRVSSNKFRLVRRLHQFVSSQGSLGDQCGRSHFWRLKNSIPPIEQLQEDDIDAFSALLVHERGNISGFGIESTRAPAMRTPDPQHRKTHDSTMSSPRHHIIASLLGLLDANDASQIHVAYTTLRLVMSVPSTGAHDPSSRSHGLKELEFLRKYPFTPWKRPNRNINELQHTSYVDIAGDFRKWITTVATLLSDTLAGQDPLYAQLASILQADSVFAEQAIPLLVLSVLQMDSSHQSTKEQGSHSEVLSQYFTSILSSESANTSCIKCIVDVVLHLRQFKPPAVKDPLAHDKWLDINFLLLSRNAISCGAYTTALLFLELAAEYNDPLEDETARTEKILFDIYSHIDEPDGFYGIKTRDLRNFLVKRFHHEKQWDKAFRFHGAALEAGDNDPTEAEGVLQSLHSFGFHNLAIKALQSNPGPESVPHSSEMSYHLGWRTETWDLPDKAEESYFGAPLYLALRAIYRERDPESVDAVVRHSLYDQMSQLRILGEENLVEIRLVAQNLMCLNQIKQWRAEVVQRNLTKKKIDLEQWCNEVSQDFECVRFQNIRFILKL